ncbi:hypothetical protein DJ021_05020 [Phenylobacterium hankyongense]|uniref:GGDEF domain-containing protein n=1 Tax=Phenylobacterium hankyongense TaxID=1813876 RepID=A0A328AZU7_9CAUL|nr:hypothetical protein [Phenylobacterium hankyongense]RAK59206.1 hypothetical protein DJ021_05020 [Phenylobacterium hankyongense]
MPDPISLLIIALSVGACLFALIRGGPAERLAGGVILASLVVSLLSNWLAPRDLAPTISLAGDGIVALAILFVTLSYGKAWLGAAMLLFAGQFALHAFYLVTGRAPDLLHAMVNNFNIIAIIICLVIGTLAARREA